MFTILFSLVVRNWHKTGARFVQFHASPIECEVVIQEPSIQIALSMFRRSPLCSRSEASAQNSESITMQSTCVQFYASNRE